MRALSPQALNVSKGGTLWVLGIVCVACGTPTTSGVAAVESLTTEGDARAMLDEHLLPHVPPSYLPAGARVVFDHRDDGATLEGTPERALADSDPERVVVLAAGAGGASLGGALDGVRVLDARFVEDGVVLLGADHILRVYREGHVTVLDDEVEAPLSVVGTSVAYARGQMPSFELARADVVTGVAHALTNDMAPVWSPALSPDAREIVFVSGRTGAPRLYRVLGTGAPVLLPEVGAFPSSLDAPRWNEGDTLTFEDEAGARHVLGLDAPEALVP